MKALEMLTPKNIILNSLISKLEGTGVIKITASFNVDDNSHEVVVTYATGVNEPLELDKKDISTIKFLMINKIVKAWKKIYEEIPVKVLIQIDIKAETLETFIQDTTDKVLHFNY